MTAATHDPDAEEAAAWLRAYLPGWLFRRLPRWLIHRPYSLPQTIRYILEAEFTPEDSGSPRRWGHWVWLVVVLIPTWSVANMAIWATAIPSRGLSIVGVWTVVATGLNSLPVFAGVIPDWWTLPYWWAVVSGWWAA